MDAQASGLVPIVEPEVLLDGDHDIDRTLEVAEAIWAETFKYMADNGVLFEGILLKPSMVTPGADCPNRASPETVADYTLKLLTRRVPPAVPGMIPTFKNAKKVEQLQVLKTSAAGHSRMHARSFTLP